MKSEAQPSVDNAAKTIAESDAGGTSTDFKIAEIRKNGNVVTALVLETEDGRMFVAEPKDGVELDVVKSSKVTIKHDGIIDGVPLNPVVTKADR